MGSATPLETLGTVCKRYGPGRLPRADRREIGAGYAGASAAVVIAAVFAIGMFAFHQFGPAVETWAIHSFWGLSALVAIPIVVATAFLAGAIVWRSLPETVPYFGAVAGLLATVLTYLASLAVVFLVLVGAILSDGGSSLETAVVESGMLTMLVGIFAVLLTGWLTLPIGCASGAIYERARTVSRE